MEWISVEDRLPGYGQEVFAWSVCNTGHVELAVFASSKKQVKKGELHFYSARTSYSYGGYITHWMPLPEPPEDK